MFTINIYWVLSICQALSHNHFTYNHRSILTIGLQSRHCYYVHVTEEKDLCKIKGFTPNCTAGEGQSRNSNLGWTAPKPGLDPGHHTEAKPQRGKPAHTDNNPAVVYSMPSAMLGALDPVSVIFSALLQSRKWYWSPVAGEGGNACVIPPSCRAWTWRSWEPETKPAASRGRFLICVLHWEGDEPFKWAYKADVHDGMAGPIIFRYWLWFHCECDLRNEAGINEARS